MTGSLTQSISVYSNCVVNTNNRFKVEVKLGIGSREHTSGDVRVETHAPVR